VAVTVFGLVSAALAWPAQARYLEAAERGQSYWETWTAFDLASIAQLPLTIAVYVVTCLWLYRARTNAAVLQPYLHHARSPGWAWGGWVCPVVNFWFPYQVVRDVARDPQAPRPVPGIGAWWTSWLLSTVVSGVGAQFAGTDTSPVPVFGALMSAGAVLQAVALVLWLRIVREITQQQERRMGVIVPR
jgi:heme/copper-type cytochrome/quinol oxidase subunit 2